MTLLLYHSLVNHLRKMLEVIKEYIFGSVEGITEELRLPFSVMPVNLEGQ